MEKNSFQALVVILDFSGYHGDGKFWQKQLKRKATYVLMNKK
jgi:hypothetical protein